MLAVAIADRKAPLRLRLVERNAAQTVNLKIRHRHFARHHANREVRANNAQRRLEIGNSNTMQHALADRRGGAREHYMHGA